MLALAASTPGAGGPDASSRVAARSVGKPPAAVRKQLDALEAGLARLNADVRAGRVKPRSRALRQRITSLLLLRVRLAAALPETLGSQFGSVHGRLTGLEGSLDRAREAAVFFTASAPVRKALVAAHGEARALERLLRPDRAAKAERTLVRLTRSLDALIARLGRSKKQPVTLKRDLRRLAQLTSTLEATLPSVFGGSFARVHFQLRWLDYALANTIYTSERRDTLGFVADGAAFARELERAFAGRTAAERQPTASEAIGRSRRVTGNPVPGPVFELLKKMNEELEKLIGEVERGQVEPGSAALHDQVWKVRSLKSRLMDELPPPFQRPPPFPAEVKFWSIYTSLSELDRCLESAWGRDEGAQSAALDFRDDLTCARVAKVGLEYALRAFIASAPELVGKLTELNKRLDAIQDSLTESWVAFVKRGGTVKLPRTLRSDLGELLHLKAEVVDRFPKVFGVDFPVVYLNLKWLDGALDRAYSRGTGRELLGALKEAVFRKRHLENVFRAVPAPPPPAPPPPPLEVGVTIRTDHDPKPQSDACVDGELAGLIAGQTADVEVRLRGPGPFSVVEPAFGIVKLLVNAPRMRLPTQRFLLNEIGTYEALVEVKTSDGRTASARKSFDNATPTDEKCE